MRHSIILLFLFQALFLPGSPIAAELIWGSVLDVDKAAGTLELRIMGASEKSPLRTREQARVRVRFTPDELPRDIRPGTVVNIWGESIPGETPVFVGTAIQRERRGHDDPTGVRSRLGRGGHHGGSSGGGGQGHGGPGGGGGAGGGGGSGGGGSGGGGGGGGGRR